jgi:hypothetical protein
MYSIFDLIVFNLAILILCFLFSRTHKFSFLKIFVLTIIISSYFGFRSLNVGPDTIIYYARFVNSSDDFEVGFTLLNRLILTVFGNDHRVYFTLINFVMIMNLLIASRIIVKYPIYIYTAWILVSLPYSILMQINIIRQGLALSFFVLGISFFLNKQSFFGTILSLLSISLHTSIIIYIISYFLTYFLSVKKDKRVILIFIFFLFSITNIPLDFIQSIKLPYIDTRIFIITNLNDSLSIFVKISFYIFLFFIIEYLMIDKGLYKQQISLFSFIIMSSAILIFQNELFSVRYLLALDFLIPILLLSKATFYKNKHFFFASSFLVFLVFLISIYSLAFASNFNF